MGIASVIIAGIFAVGGTLLSSYFTSQEVDDAKEESLKLANISRADKLKIDEANEKLNWYQVRQRDKELAFQKTEAEAGRAERKKINDYNMQMDQFNNALGFINSSETLRGNFLSMMKR